LAAHNLDINWRMEEVKLSRYSPLCNNYTKKMERMKERRKATMKDKRDVKCIERRMNENEKMKREKKKGSRE